MSDCWSESDLGAGLPPWVPTEARTYLVHTETGLPIRALARETGLHASTVLRQVRALEARREDMLVDHALNRLGTCVKAGAKTRTEILKLGSDDLNAEAQRVLLRLCEPGTLLAVALEMDKAVVVKETENGDTVRRAVVSREVAEAMALKNWIECASSGRISRYRMTAAGRATLKSLLALSENRAAGFGEASAPFRDGALRGADSPERETRYQHVEPPLTLLARRRDRKGRPYLPTALVQVGERLREDFEMAALSGQAEATWDEFLADAEAGLLQLSPASRAARNRVVGALRDLGAGLGEAALHCCCYLEGLEKIEQRFGWSASSGKVVLRIALQRLRLHYEALGESGAMIG